MCQDEIYTSEQKKRSEAKERRKKEEEKRTASEAFQAAKQLQKNAAKIKLVQDLPIVEVYWIDFVRHGRDGVLYLTDKNSFEAEVSVVVDREITGFRDEGYTIEYRDIWGKSRYSIDDAKLKRTIERNRLTAHTFRKAARKLK